ncbi:MAG: Na+:solute symporter [Flavobacteriaceae bacterium]|nr:Na+:solute symporter [Flavobacteriaceae bacterium]MCY4267500.1 Na+:solute symporter [Flavobacteriaceae bacterium]MCY4299440.1 Na+:solute symporter [Flavobacteriaceae bacterium]
MQLETIDWIIVILFFVISLAIGLYSSKTAGKSLTEFFLSGRNMPWWLLGISMVATTFSSDTPNLVTDIVRKNGVAGNWVWWAFLLTGMLTVFLYARLWRRSKVLTDLEFYEIRYGGKGAAFLRGFRAIYLGFLFNIMVMATVCLAAIKIGAVLLGLSSFETLFIASLITVVYSSLGGLKGVIITDFFQFLLAIGATIAAAIFILNLPQIGGLTNLLNHSAITPKLSLIPPSNTEIFITIFLIPIAVQWWSVWYPGAEPGGGGYISQRMLSAKDEKNAVWATLLFNFMHYAIRPWPWILIALASIIVFPNLQSLQQAFPTIDPSVINDDLAYPAMLSYLPTGLLGLMVASLVAAFMSTISSHLNWGSSYIVNDFYKRFINPKASEKKLVLYSRLSTILLMVLSGALALALSNALQAFQILLQIGAGTGLLFILRWFWYRINIYSELTAMVVSFLVAVYFQIIHTNLGFAEIESVIQLLLGVGITTVFWVGVTLLTKPEKEQTLFQFYHLIQPAGIGWSKIRQKALSKEGQLKSKASQWDITNGIICMLLGSVAIYSILFGTGFLLYNQQSLFLITLIIATVSLVLLFWVWKKFKSGVH